MNDSVFFALKAARVPDSVVAKLKPLQDREFSRGDFEKEIAKFLNPEELKQFRNILMKRTVFHKYEAGMYGNISIAAIIPNTLTLPAEAILTDGNRHYCFVLEDGKAKRVVVKTGITNDAVTEVLMKQLPPTKLGADGAFVKFTGTEQIITSNLKSIQDGQPARAK
jgi:hypothetical protein